ncbi:PREDICTED: target of rapamycin complex 2 subunit MAPKAP1-like, partial [Tauraco erythrolophus]|uniref:target of rapamycin complex 2 subunit MAPKAP1-like n=1 Tax=Tauraco erythrolophus TaxID=121530 RepID=UPI0005236198
LLYVSGPQYRLEKQSEPNVPVDLDCTLESQSTLEFCLVRENSSRGEEVSEEDPQIDIATVQDMLSSHHYKSFKVSMIHRLRFTTDVQLGISGDKVEIDPVTNQKASTKFWIKQKPISIDSELLCACDLVEEKSPIEFRKAVTVPGQRRELRWLEGGLDVPVQPVINKRSEFAAFR